MGSYEIGKAEVSNYLQQRFIRGKTALDVGACDGKWKRLLGDHFVMNAVEPFVNNIATHNLDLIYNIVYLCKIQDLPYKWYDLIIMGDVLEHMTVKDARKVIKYAYPRCDELLIAVPYLYEQGELYGNPYEVHLQPDLTHEIFMDRYPGFKVLWQNDVYGYYVKDGD